MIPVVDVGHVISSGGAIRKSLLLGGSVCGASGADTFSGSMDPVVHGIYPVMGGSVSSTINLLLGTMYSDVV